MPKRKSPYEVLIVAKQRKLASVHVVESLREATKLSMTFGDFIEAMQASPSLTKAVRSVRLRDVFTGIADPDEPIKATGGRPKRKVRVANKGRANKAKARKTRRKKTVARKTRRKKTGVRKTRRRKATRQPKADPVMLAKRLDAVVAVLRKNGDWMKTGDIYAMVSTKKRLFAGVEVASVSQYLGKLVAEKPARVKKKGKGAGSMSRIAG